VAVRLETSLLGKNTDCVNFFNSLWWFFVGFRELIPEIKPATISQMPNSPMNPDELVAMSVELQEFAAEYAALADQMVRNDIESIPQSGRRTFNTVVVSALRRNIRRISGRIDEECKRRG
jgi:hypothetical protein